MPPRPSSPEDPAPSPALPGNPGTDADKCFTLTDFYGKTFYKQIISSVKGGGVNSNRIHSSAQGGGANLN